MRRARQSDYGGFRLFVGWVPCLALALLFSRFLQGTTNTHPIPNYIIGVALLLCGLPYIWRTPSHWLIRLAFGVFSVLINAMIVFLVGFSYSCFGIAK